MPRRSRDARRPRGDGRRGHEPRRGQARPGQVRPHVVHGTKLDRAEIDRQIELYRTRSADERRDIVGLQPNRAEVILAGACVVRTMLTKLGCDSFVVSDRGLRHGLIVARFGVGAPVG